MARWLVPTPAGAVWLLVAAWLLATRATYLVSADSDSVFHILLGELMLDRGGLLHSEPTTWTYPDGELSAHEWGSQLILALAHRLGGLAAVSTLTALAIASPFAILMVWFQRLRLRWPTALLALAAAAAVAVMHFHARPHVLTWSLATGWVIGLELLHRRELPPKRWLAVSTAVMVLWVNLHGGFLFAFFLLGAYILAGLVEVATADDTPARDAAVSWTVRLAGAGVVLLLASALNPQGLALHTHLLGVAGAETQALVGDSAAPNLMQRPHLLLYLLGSLFLLVAGRNRPSPRVWMLVFLLAAMSLQSIRNFPVMGFAGAVVLGPRLQALWDQLCEGNSWAAQLARALRGRPLAEPHGEVATPALGILLALLSLGRPVAIDRSMQPMDAIDFVKTRPELAGRRMFNPYNWGCVISWELYPSHKTFINSWSDYHGNERVQRLIDLERLAPGWEETFDALDIEWAFHRVDAPLTHALRDRGWEEVYRDNMAAILVRPED